MATLRMASEHCARAKARDGDAEIASEDPSPSDAPTAPGSQLAQLAEDILELVQEREQRVWSLQLDARDLRSQIESVRSSESGAQARSLLVRVIQGLRLCLFDCAPDSWLQFQPVHQHISKCAIPQASQRAVIADLTKKNGCLHSTATALQQENGRLTERLRVLRASVEGARHVSQGGAGGGAPSGSGAVPGGATKARAAARNPILRTVRPANLTQTD